MSDAAEQHRSYAPRRLGFAGLTVSDSRTESDDDSGQVIERTVAESSHQLVLRRIRPDDSEAVRQAIEQILEDPAVDVVVVSGGTGVSPRDVTVEAAVPLFEREVPGFGEIFRRLSFDQIGAPAMLSRATAGVLRGKAIFLLPGSPKAVELAMERLILPEAAHLVGQARRTEG